MTALFGWEAEMAFFFILGTFWGSFGNVCIHRIPLGQSVAKPLRSYCPQCKKTIPWYFNIPIFGWIFLRGKCFECKKKISVRYPIVELLVGSAFAGVYWKYGLSWTSLEFCIFAWGLIIASFIDLDHMILPDVFTLSGIVLGLTGALISPERQILDAFLGFLIGGGLLYFVSWTFYKLKGVEGLGGGDIKLLAWIGAYLGWQSIAFVLMISCISGGVLGLIYLTVTGQSRDTHIPFGPFISVAALIYIYFGDVGFLTFLFPFSGSL